MTHPSLSRPALHTSAIYFALFASMGVYVPFWSLWLEDWGLSKAEVGTFMAATIAVRVVAGLALPILADKLDRRRVMLVTLCLIGGALFALHLLIESRAILLLATIAVGVILASVMPLGEALGQGAAHKHGFAYAPARAFGSLSFLIFAYLTGYLVGWFGMNVVILLVVGTYLVSAGMALNHPGGGAAGDKSLPSLAEIARIIVNPTFALFGLGIGCLQASHAVYFTYSSIHWRDLGLSEEVIGQLWAFSVAAEIVLIMGPGTWLVARLGAIGAIAISGVIAALRWLAMMTDPTGTALWALQASHAATFGLGHLGAMAFIAAAIPERANASAQGAYSGLAVGGLLALSTLVAKFLFPTFAGQTYLLGAVTAALGVVACVLLARRWKGNFLGV